MKIRKLTLLLLSLASAALLCPPAHAAKAPKSIGAVKNPIKKSTKKNKVDGPADLAATDELPWYLELSGVYYSTGGDEARITNYKGATLALGWRITQEDRVQFEIGCNTGQHTGDFSWTMPVRLLGTTPGPNNTVLDYVQVNNVPMSGRVTAKSTLVPLLIAYKYSIRPLSSPKLGFLSTDRLELRLNPFVGALAMKGTWSMVQILKENPNVAGLYDIDQRGRFIIPAGSTVRYPGYTGGNAVVLLPLDRSTGSDSFKLVATVGIGGCLTYNLSSRLYLDFTYRYMWISKASNPQKTPVWDGLNAANGGSPWGGVPWNSVAAWNGMNATSYTLSAGFKF